MAYDGSLIFDTKIDNKGFKKGVDGLKSTASSAMKVVNGLMVAGAVAVAGIGVASVKAGAEFEKGMSGVASTMGITVDEINKGDKSFQMLEKAALDMGKSTQFSATQATEALNYLALAGYDAEKATEALPKVLNLAAAGGLELGYASDLVTDSMSALGLETKDLDVFVDQLAKTSQKSNTDVAQLGEAILTVGGTAKILKGGTAELNAQLGILADNGIKGSEGGTALRNVLLSLSAPTDKQAAAMKSLGVETYDANGNLRSTDDIFQDLNGVLGEMTDEEKTQVLSELFNKVDLKAANALLAGSGDRFLELSESIEQSEGAAEEMAATMNDNLLGKIELMKSAMEYLGIVIYKSVDSPIKDVVETFTGYIDQISGVLTAHDDARASMEELGYSAGQIEEELKDIPNGLEGAAVVMGEILADMVVKLAEGAPRFLEMGVSLTSALLDGLRENLPQISESAVELIQGFATAYLEMVPQVMVLGIELVTNLIQGIAEMLPELIPVAIEALNVITGALIENLPLIMEAGIEILMALADGIIEQLPELMGVATEIVLMLVEKIVENLPELILIGIEMLLAITEGLIDNVSLIIETAPGLVSSLVEGLIDNLPEIIEAGLELITALAEGLLDNIPLLIDSALQIIDSLTDFLIDNLDLVIDSALQIVLAIVEGLLDNLPLLIDAAVQLVVGIVEGLIRSLPKLVQAGIDLVVGLVRGLLNATPQLVSAGIQLITSLIGAIIRMIPQLIALGFQLLGELVGGILKGTGLILQAGVTIVKTFISGTKSMLSGVVRIGEDLVKGIWNGINNVTGWILSKIKGFGTTIIDGVKGVFGVKSPSRVMRDEVGVMIGRGLANGIDESKGDVDDSAKKMSKSVIDVMKNLNSNTKEITNKHNKEIARIHKRAREDIELIELKAAKSKRRLTAAEQVRVQRITEDSLKKVVAIEEKAAKDREKIAKENSKLLLEMSDDFITEKKKKGELSLLDEVNYWDQLSKVVQSGSEEYKKVLENKQNVINQISSEILKINEDYTQQMLDIDKRLIDETKKLNDEYSQAYEKRVTDLVGVGGLFDEFVANDRIAGDELISNMESQIVALAQYEGYIGILGERIGNADLMGELKGLGPKAVGELESLVSLSDEQLAEYVNLYEVKFKMATRQAEKELEPMKKNTEKQIQDLNKAAQTELDVLQSDWTKSIQKLVSGTEKELDSLKGVGANAIKGLEEGMLSMEDGLMATANRIANSIRSTIQSALQINSPSRLMRDEVGKNIIRGIGVGLEDEMPSLQRDINKEMSKLTHKMKSTVEFETSSSARAMTGSSGYSRGSETVTNNNDNGVVQNVTIVSPENTPSENARALRKVGRDLALGY